MYSVRQGLILGFHGTDESVVDKILCGDEADLKKSENPWEWLGKGIYFFEYDPQRAYDFAKQVSEGNAWKGHSKITEPDCIGAVITLGRCLDFSVLENIDMLKIAHNNLKKIMDKADFETLRNHKGRNILDCTVI